MNTITNTALPLIPSCNYKRLASLWSAVLGENIDERQVALCINQIYVSKLIDQPEQSDVIVQMAQNLFKYEALANEKAV